LLLISFGLPLNKLPDPEELLNLLGLGLISLLLISFGLPLKSSVEYAFSIDAPLLSSPYSFFCDDEIFKMMIR